MIKYYSRLHTIMSYFKCKSDSSCLTILHWHKMIKSKVSYHKRAAPRQTPLLDSVSVSLHTPFATVGNSFSNLIHHCRGGEVVGRKERLREKRGSEVEIEWWGTKKQDWGPQELARHKNLWSLQKANRQHTGKGTGIARTHRALQSLARTGSHSHGQLTQPAAGQTEQTGNINGLLLQ